MKSTLWLGEYIQFHSWIRSVLPPLQVGVDHTSTPSSIQQLWAEWAVHVNGQEEKGFSAIFTEVGGTQMWIKSKEMLEEFPFLYQDICSSCKKNLLLAHSSCATWKVQIDHWYQLYRNKAGKISKEKLEILKSNKTKQITDFFQMARQLGHNEKNKSYSKISNTRLY